ncbi:MAG: Holliday junction resolvase RuvX [Anaerolineaceae bacterium]
MSCRFLGIDPGNKRIGVAISDLTGTIARPLKVILHTSREKDAQEIAALVQENEISCIVVGQALQDDGTLSIQGRRAARLAEAIKIITNKPVVLWDESGTTQSAQRYAREMDVPRSRRAGHLDDFAASILLQDYLEANRMNQENNFNET